MAAETREVVVKPEHLAAAIEYFDKYPEAATTSGCLMNQALREVFPEFMGTQESDHPGGEPAYSCGSQAYEAPSGGGVWHFDGLGEKLVTAFDGTNQRYADRREAFPIALPVTVVITKEGWED